MEVPNRRVEPVKQLHAAQEYIRQIAREEVKNRVYVREIVRSYAMPQYIEEVRKELLECAVEAIRYALETETDGRLAYRLLSELGII